MKTASKATRRNTGNTRNTRRLADRLMASAKHLENMARTLTERAYKIRCEVMDLDAAAQS